MHLECAQGSGANPARPQDIEEVFRDDQRRGEFAILTDEDGSFVQVAGQGEGPFTVEFFDKASDQHWVAAKRHSKNEALSVFLAFAKGERSWRDSIEWTELDSKSGGCRNQAALLVLALTGLAVIAWYT
ncbi:MAG: hypothetical protein AAF497_29930 [Planctomycetota bacterium]